MNVLGKVLVSASKVGILQELSKQPKSFSELTEALNETSGNLNYHLLTLQKENLVQKVGEKYSLSSAGREAVSALRRIAATA